MKLMVTIENEAERVVNDSRGRQVCAARGATGTDSVSGPGVPPGDS